jgi:organic radical activating enzyme
MMIYKSPIKIDNVEETRNELSKSAGVIVFGTGNVGLIALNSLKNQNIDVICLSDNNISRWGDVINGCKIIPPEELKSTENKTPILIANNLNFTYIRRQLRDLGLTNVYDCDFIFSKLDVDIKECNLTWTEANLKKEIDLYMYSLSAWKEKETSLKVKNIDLVLTEKCSLKCKDCSNLMQFYAKPVDEDYDLLIPSINNFMNTVDYVHEIRLIGGEPLLYKKIDHVINHLLSLKNFGKIIINTNGTIVLKGDKMKVFQNDKIFFDISNYGKLSRNLDKLLQELTRLNIAHNYRTQTSWQDAGRIVKTNRTDEENKEIFGNCCQNQGLSILHGKLYLCPFSANATNLKGIPYAKKDIVDLNIDDKKELKRQISELYFNAEFLEACRACKGRHSNVDTVPVAVQTKVPLKYAIVS